MHIIAAGSPSGYNADIQGIIVTTEYIKSVVKTVPDYPSQVFYLEMRPAF